MIRAKYTKDGQQVQIVGGDIDGIFCWGHVANNGGSVHYWTQQDGRCMSYDPHMSRKESDRLSNLDLVLQ